MTQQSDLSWTKQLREQLTSNRSFRKPALHRLLEISNTVQAILRGMILLSISVLFVTWEITVWHKLSFYEIVPTWLQNENLKWQTHCRDFKIWSHIYRVNDDKSVESIGIVADLTGWKDLLSLFPVYNEDTNISCRFCCGWRGALYSLFLASNGHDTRTLHSYQNKTGISMLFVDVACELLDAMLF